MGIIKNIPNDIKLVSPGVLKNQGVLFNPWGGGVFSIVCLKAILVVACYDATMLRSGESQGKGQALLRIGTPLDVDLHPEFF